MVLLISAEGNKNKLPSVSKGGSNQIGKKNDKRQRSGAFPTVALALIGPPITSSLIGKTFQKNYA